MESKLETRRLQFKALISTQLEDRKKSQKQRSDEERSALLLSLRSAADTAPGSSRRPPSVQKLFSRTFMHPDTLVDIPTDLKSQWMVVLRPEGERCLVVLKNNTITLRSRNGNIIGDTHILDPFRYLSRFDVDAIFDAVLSNELYIFDVLLFNQNELVNSEFEFRQFFLEQNWPFLSGKAPAVFMDDETGDSTIPEIHRLEAYQVSAASLQTLYDSSEYEKDSLVFFRKTGKYENGLSSEALYFRDDKLSKYAIDSKHESGFAGDEDMDLVLVVWVKDKRVELKTWDKIRVLEFNSESEAEHAGIVKSLLKDKTKIRASLNVGEFKFEKFSQTRKPFATSFNRVVDQVRKRKAKLGIDCANLPPIFQASPVTFTDIMNSIR